jgi:hypothetical protein
VDDAPHKGRPPISTALVKFIIETVTKNSTTRGWSCARIAAEVSSTPGWQPVSPSTVYRALTQEGYGVFKKTIKPGLTKEQMDARLEWCYKYRHYDWRHVIFSDETSVQLGGVRGRRRVWRKKNETHHPYVIARRWKGFQEFIWWSCFTYDEKGPYHIWEAETPAERKAATADLAARNAAKYDKDHADWLISYSD